MKLRFGTFLAPNMLGVYQAIANEVGRRLNVEIELIVETDYENCVRDLNDVCFVCSLPYIEFERSGISPSVPIAAPVLDGKRYENKPIYYSDVIVRTDSQFKSFKDLKGHTWCYNEPHSQSGYGITRYHLVQLGETNGFFSEVVEAGFHEESIRLVAEGKIDASAIDSQVLSIALRDNPQLASKLRIIEALGPSTIQPVAVSKRLPAELREKIQGILLSLHKDEKLRKQLAFGFIDHFVAVGPESYDDIRDMLSACENADFMKIR